MEYLVVAVNYENGHVMSRGVSKPMEPQDLADYMAGENAGVYADELLTISNGSDGPVVLSVCRSGDEFEKR